MKRDKASFEWDFASPEASYEISVDNGSEQFEVQTKDTSFTFTQQAGIRDYKFAVRAANACGFGPLSPQLSVSFAGEPEQMKPVEATVEGCALLINWAAPYDSGSPIAEYDIQLQVRPGILISLTGVFCDKDPALTSCTVPMKGLLKEPFNMKAGDRVILRAFAVNEAGRSKPSAVTQSDTRIIAVPAALSAPTLAKETTDSMLIKWEASEASDVVYEVYGDTTSKGQLAKIGETKETQLAVEKVDERRFFNF